MLYIVRSVIGGSFIFSSGNCASLQEQQVKIVEENFFTLPSLMFLSIICRHVGSVIIS